MAHHNQIRKDCQRRESNPNLPITSLNHWIILFRCLVIPLPFAASSMIADHKNGIHLSVTFKGYTILYYRTSITTYTRHCVKRWRLMTFITQLLSFRIITQHGVNKDCSKHSLRYYYITTCMCLSYSIITAYHRT